MHWIYSITLLILLEGCSYPIYQKVLVPTKCGIELREKPARSGDVTKDIQRLLGYMELLEEDLRFCIKGRDKD
ncbi:hypothetical protein BKH44_06145 [Helicobacter sp. 13S00477-4]|nr:hypothetical protein BKH44_06145 [Helicobacter sp. 13S00477-4]